MGALLLITAAAGLVATPAQAQDDEERIQKVDFSLTLRHDSNAARADPERAAQRGLELSDQRATVGANVVVSRALGRNTLKLDGFVGYDFYRRNTQLDRERIAAVADIGLVAGPCNMHLMPEFTRRQSELGELSVIDAPGIASVRNIETIQVYRGELRCGRVDGLQPLVIYERSEGDNSNFRRKLQDYRSERYGAGLGYSNPIIGTYNISYEREQLDYPDRSVSVPGAVAGYRLDEIRFAATRDIGRIVTANGFVAHSRLKPKNSNARSFKGLSWRLGLTVTPSDQFVFKGLFAKSIIPSLAVDALYSVNQDMSADLTYFLSGKTSIGLVASRVKRDYRGASFEIERLLRNYKTNLIAARIKFRPNDRLSFLLEGGRENRDANDAFYDYGNTFISFTTTFSLGSQ